MAETLAREALDELNPRLLLCFVTLAEELHFGAAADRLFVTQPALSRSIRRLEAVLGRSLFTRTTREVGLTRAGSALLEPGREVLRRQACCSVVTKTVIAWQLIRNDRHTPPGRRHRVFIVRTTTLTCRDPPRARRLRCKSARHPEGFMRSG